MNCEREKWWGQRLLPPLHSASHEPTTWCLGHTDYKDTGTLSFCHCAQPYNREINPDSMVTLDDIVIFQPPPNVYKISFPFFLYCYERSCYSLLCCRCYIPRQTCCIISGYKVRWCYCLSTVSERSHDLGLTNSWKGLGVGSDLRVLHLSLLSILPPEMGNTP